MYTLNLKKLDLYIGQFSIRQKHLKTRVMLNSTVLSEATVTSEMAIQGKCLEPPDYIDLNTEAIDHVEISTFSNQGLHSGQKSKDDAPATESVTTFSKYRILFKSEYI